jgi:hypothetical protein
MPGAAGARLCSSLGLLSISLFDRQLLTSDSANTKSRLVTGLIKQKVTGLDEPQHL